MKERIGFIGLGLMGFGMATNIVRKGWPLTVMAHRKREAIETLLKAGAQEARTPKAIAEASDIVILCVTGSPQVEEVINGPDGLVAAGKPLMIIDCSTSNPSVTVKLAEELAAKNIILVDAPMSRTPKDAMEGTLDIMAGGSDADFARAKTVIDAFAGRVIHTGPVGSGHTMKLLNNFISMGYAALYSEALMLGVKAGLTPKVFDSVIRNGRMDCGFYQTFFKYVIERDKNAHQFTLSNAHKDMSYLASAAVAMGAANPMGSAVRNAFATAVGTGQGEKYVPMLSDIVAELNGVSLVEPAR
ncbi:NAD(P)-dependent oxidoreductase [Lichenifustis flavocetrariae]|uniref:NAD(P)-dependent oxidoreductase n=1 Tax=Lichenifustis flavocetrariae TaxID=2949735 RepID=A0AA41YTM9_9HYPH|nr:NAD(P)-dependent oxidoreductase [Lichenifustis flavocetrariae]MCW6507110.1 NAD(P)-dependent oxidoreductase [Lichenifustis flavocetrariae]